jgi:hypothetical protein
MVGGPVTVARRQVLRMRRIPGEQLLEAPLRRPPHRHHPFAAVDVLEEKPLQFAFSRADGGGMGHETWAMGADRRHGVDPPRLQPGPGAGEEVGHLAFDQFVQDRAAQFHWRQRTEPVAHRGGGRRHEGKSEQFVELHQSQLHRIVGIVGVVGDRVGGIHHLRLEQGRLARRTGDAGRLRVEDLPGEVEAGKPRIAGFEQLHDPQRLGVVVEAAAVGKEEIEGVFPGMPERWMADVVREGERLDQILVEGQSPGQGARDAGDLEGVCEAAAVVVAVVAGEDLRLVSEPAEGRRVDHAVAVPLVGAAEGVGGFLVDSPHRVGSVHRPRGQDQRLAGLPVGRRCGGGGHGRGSAAAAAASCSQRASRAWEMTRTPAIAGMKLTSPGQRGRRCQWR